LIVLVGSADSVKGKPCGKRFSHGAITTRASLTVGNPPLKSYQVFLELFYRFITHFPRLSLDPALKQQEIVQEIADRPTTVNFTTKDVESRSADFPTSTCEESEYFYSSSSLGTLRTYARCSTPLFCSITPKMYHHH
jgi:hypothetical protein